MGGSSTINAMIYVRGNKADFDGWAEAGNVGWSYKDVLPYFIKAENNSNPELLDFGYHGYSGYLNVKHTKFRTKLKSKFISAGNEFGWQEGDYNGKTQKVLGSVQYTMDGMFRESTSKAYLNPIRRRKNLHILRNAIVSKINTNGNIAIGVDYYKKGNKYTVLARKEVILSAGAINSPKLLMLSGIGPMDELKKHKIEVLANLPVGQKLADHLFVPIYFQINQNITITPSMWKTNDSIESYVVDKDGPLTTIGAEALTFVNVFNSSESPNLQIILMSNDDSDNTPYFTFLLSNVNPQSEGSVRLKSNDWRDPPVIDPNYFSKEIDFKVFEEGFKLSLQYIKTPSMKKLSPKLFINLYPDCKSPSDNEVNANFVKCIIHHYSSSIFHPVATAKMGTDSDKNSVVTPDLLVKGFTNIRVIDASVMPTITRGNTNAPTIMIAEKGADIIKSLNALWLAVNIINIDISGLRSLTMPGILLGIILLRTFFLFLFRN